MFQVLLSSSVLLFEHCLLWSIAFSIFLSATSRSPWATAASLKFMFWIAWASVSFSSSYVFLLFAAHCPSTFLASSVLLLSQTSLVSFVPASVLPVVFPSLHLFLLNSSFSFKSLFPYALYLSYFLKKFPCKCERCVALHVISRDLWW